MCIKKTLPAETIYFKMRRKTERKRNKAATTTIKHKSYATTNQLFIVTPQIFRDDFFSLSLF